MQDPLTDGTQRTYARLAGFMFLLNYAVNVFGVLTPLKIKDVADFAERAQRVIDSEQLYRSALTSATIGWVTIVILGFALFVVLEPVNKRLAQLALFFRLGEAFVGGAAVLWSFATLRLYTSAQGEQALQNEQLQALIRVTANATDTGFYVAWTFFAPGSLLFFYLFYKSGYIPRALAALGMFGSVVMLLGNFGALIFPKHAGTMQYGWAPIGIAEITTAFWLIIAGIKSPSSESSFHRAPDVTG